MVYPRSAYIFFWKRQGPYAWASQWQKSPFTAMIAYPNKEPEPVEFLSAEHWMMHSKALLFNDEHIARLVLEIGADTGADLKAVKDLGRQVRGFDETIWVEHRERIVKQGNVLKFEQNEELRRLLLETGDKILVEASPFDRIWGIGKSEKDINVNDTSRWGLNLLGKILMEVRMEVRDAS